MTTSAMYAYRVGEMKDSDPRLLPWRMPEHRAEAGGSITVTPVPHAACDARRARRRIVDVVPELIRARAHAAGATIRSPPIFRRASSSHGRGAGSA